MFPYKNITTMPYYIKAITNWKHTAVFLRKKHTKSNTKTIISHEHLAGVSYTFKSRHSYIKFKLLQH